MDLSTPSPIWERFDSVRTTETRGDSRFLLNHISLSIPALDTHRAVLEKIASRAQVPIAIQSLAEVLSQTILLRGKTIFGFVGDEIEKIVAQYDDMHWWISEKGLNMAVVPLAAAKLSRFDEFAGKLCVDKWKDGKLSKNSLIVVAKKLDAAGFLLKVHLQPAQWNPIAAYNQRNPRKPIRTFEQVCGYAKYVRSIRRRLYVARERCVKANAAVSSPPGMS